MPLLLATRNLHKLHELEALFAGAGLSLVSLRDRPDLPEVEEDGETLEANAIKKAVAMRDATGLPALADDTGLEVEALGGEPGVRSARYAGEPPDYAANNRKLLAALAGERNRAACFRTVIALATLEDHVRVVEGRVDGVILDAPRGDAGFGYDPVFVPHGFDRSFAEMTDEEKNRCSHRARALANALDAWQTLLTPTTINH